MRVRIELVGEDSVEVFKEVSENTFCELRAIAKLLNEQRVPYAPEMHVIEVVG